MTVIQQLIWLIIFKVLSTNKAAEIHQNLMRYTILTTVFVFNLFFIFFFYFYFYKSNPKNYIIIIVIIIIFF
jgi:hypothetical protein